MNPKLILLILLACLIAGTTVWYLQHRIYQRTCIKAQYREELRIQMRKLWEDHVIYSRSMFTSILDNVGNREAVIARLMRNQDDIGNALKPFYGEEVGNQFAALLREHIRLAIEIVQDAKNNDTTKTAHDKAAWIKNADDTAEFLSKINPYFSQDDLQRRFRTHLTSAEGELHARLKKEWNQDLNYYDQGLEDMRKLGDVLTEGILKQFPNRCE